MTPAETALALLRESRDGARIWHDDGRTVKKVCDFSGGKSGRSNRESRNAYFSFLVF